jgi:hypothetical protein
MFSEETTNATEIVRPGVDPAAKLFTLILSGYLSPLSAIAGMIGNQLSFSVMGRKRFRKHVFCFYIRALSVTDSGCLGWFLFGHLVLNIINVQTGGLPFLVRDLLYCRLTIYFTYLFYDVSIWTVVAMTVDRFIAVRYPLKAKTMCTVGRARIYVAGNFGIHTIYYIPHLFRTSATGGNLEYQSSCYLPTEFFPIWFSDVLEAGHEIIDILVPMIVLLVLNVEIMITMKSSRKDKHNLSATTDDAKASSQDLSLTIMLVLVTWIFIIFLLPYNLDYFFFHVVFPDAGPANPTARSDSLEIGLVTAYVNITLNFYLYCFGCKNFRHELARLLTCKPDK